MPIPINPHLADLAPYPPGKPIEEVKRELGLTHVVKLASNENPLGPSPRALEALRSPEREYHLYPEGHAFALRAAVAEHLGVAPGRLIFGNGSDEVLMLLALTFLTPETELITFRHAFIRPQMHATMMGAQTRIIPVASPLFEQDVDEMIRAIGPRTRMIYLANPNNPTGHLAPADRVRALAEAVPPDVLFVLDEAYHEYCAGAPDYQDSLSWLDDFSNLMVLRTFSKAHGLAGLRCGHGIGSPEVIQAIERVRPPFNVTRAAQAACVAAIADTEHVDRAVEVNRAGLAQLSEGLRDLPVVVTPSRGNFLLVDVGREGRPVFEALMRRGVIVRPMGGGYGLPRCVRVSVGTAEENALFLEALGAVLAEPAEARR